MFRPARLTLLLFACAVVAAVAGVTAFATTSRMCNKNTLGFSLWTNGQAIEGYVLAPIFHPLIKPGKVAFIDQNGTQVHTWHTNEPPLVAYLQPNGHMYVGLVNTSLDMTIYPASGTTGIIQELDWEGNVLWEYKDQWMNHDFEVLPDDSIAYLRWHKARGSFAQGVRGGQGTGDVWTNELVVIDREKEILWSWRPDDHLNPREYVMNPLTNRRDWAHANSIRYTDSNPVTGTPAFLVSMRNIDTVLIVERKTGEVLWQSPRGLFSHQHDATFTPEGTVLVFDNGMNRLEAGPMPTNETLGSRALEIDVSDNRIVWEYFEGTTPIEAGHLYSGIMSGAQRLANGNTLITSSMQGRILEVTKEKEIVWNYTNQYREGGKIFSVFKARKYAPGGTEWGSKVQRTGALSRICH